MRLSTLARPCSQVPRKHFAWDHGRPSRRKTGKWAQPGSFCLLTSLVKLKTITSMLRHMRLFLLFFLAPLWVYAQALQPGHYAICTTLTGMTNTDLKLQEATVKEQNGKTIIVFTESFSTQETHSDGDRAEPQLTNSTIEFVRHYLPSALSANNDRIGDYTEHYQGRISTKLGIIRGTVTGLWENGTTLKASFIMRRVGSN